MSGFGVSVILRVFVDVVGRGKKKEDGSGMMILKVEEFVGGSWLGKFGLGDFVWKEEVFLWVLDSLRKKFGLVEYYFSDVILSKFILYFFVYDWNWDGEGFLGMFDIKLVL